MRWIKENPSLAAGIFLPLLLMVVFAAATVIPKMLVEPPKHNLLFYVDSYSRTPDAEVRLNVSNGKLKAEFRKKKEQYSNLNVLLYYYSAATNSMHQISVLPPANATEEWQEFPVPEVAVLTLDTTQIAPDGYIISEAKYRGSHVLGLFGSSYYSRGLSIVKDGRTIMIQAPEDAYGSNTHFLGWIVAK